MTKLGLLFIIFVLSFIGYEATIFLSKQPNDFHAVKGAHVAASKEQLIQLPKSKTLQNNYHIFQSYNNCGPAAFSMTLSYYDIAVSQEVLGQELRPYQNVAGDNDDKSVTLEELAQKAETYDLTAYHRPNGSIELIKYFITNDIPVITRTWLSENEDIGHYRIIKGYDDTTKTLIQDDSFQGKNLSYSYQEFTNLWGKFNYEYLVLIPQEKKAIAQAILGEDVDFEVSWTKAVENAKKQLSQNPDDIYARFNLSVALYHTKRYKEATLEFEKIASQLPFRTLWYQIEPIQAYYELGEYDRVLSMTDAILHNQNRAFSELYLIRGEIYKKQGNTDLAKSEFEKAIFYNTSLKEANEAFNSL